MLRGGARQRLYDRNGVFVLPAWMQNGEAVATHAADEPASGFARHP